MYTVYRPYTSSYYEQQASVTWTYPFERRVGAHFARHYRVACCGPPRVPEIPCRGTPRPLHRGREEQEGEGSNDGSDDEGEYDLDRHGVGVLVVHGGV